MEALEARGDAPLEGAKARVLPAGGFFVKNVETTAFKYEVIKLAPARTPVSSSGATAVETGKSKA